MVSDSHACGSRGEPGSPSERAARLLQRLAAEYEAACRGLAQAACDYSRQALVEAHLQVVTACQAELSQLLGEEQALILIKMCLAEVDQRLAFEEGGGAVAPGERPST
ncbi:hypothetical protein [Thermogemmatispora sp.]|uniref:hypothetical protein n=1 Tax=Thermogemmatispora sp. TaxID=1968838 RepID=UPI001D36BB52|nr:hypothetical protein [Thermogemmatispora sp.]MBX5450345.1 hypothetical protein [Thermogemmatispora sp.]